MEIAKPIIETTLKPTVQTATTTLAGRAITCFLLGVLCGVLLMVVPYGNARQREIKCAEQLEFSEATVDDLAQKNLTRWRRNQAAFIEIKRLQNGGATVDSVVDVARRAMFENQDN